MNNFSKSYEHSTTFFKVDQFTYCDTSESCPVLQKKLSAHSQVRHYLAMVNIPCWLGEPYFCALASFIIYTVFISGIYACPCNTDLLTA